MSYHIFSSFYDKVMDQTVYRDWLAFVEQARRCYHPEKPELTILELACGTGKVAVELAKAGHAVTGFDLSEEMLSLAYDRMEKERVQLLLLEGDMREIEEIGTYDMVTCFSDSLCYLTEEADLQKTFDGVFRSLKAGGTFLFDVHSLFQVREVFPGYQYIYQDEEEVFLWESFEGEKENSVEHILTFFVPAKAGLFERVQEYHEERTYSMEIYEQLLKQAGFSEIGIYADFGRAPVQENTARWFFLCRKREEV